MRIADRFVGAGLWVWRRPCSGSPETDRGWRRSAARAAAPTSSRPRSGRSWASRARSATGPRSNRRGCGSTAARPCSRGATAARPSCPGKPDESLLIQAVAHTHDELKMPPKSKLPEPAVAALRRWVEMGAPWGDAAGEPRRRLATAGRAQAHWAFPPGAATSLRPRSRIRAGSASPVDAFVLARLEKDGLAPSPPADRRTLIRRATIDLLGCRRPPRRSRPSRPTRRPTPSRAWSTACSPRPATASAGAGTGSTSPATPTPRATSSQEERQLSVRLHLPRLRDPAPSTRTCPSTGSSLAAARRRPARPGRRARPAGGDGVPDASAAGSSTTRTRSSTTGSTSSAAACSGLTRRLCPLPRPQVRPDPQRGLLLALRRLRQLGRARRAAPAGAARRDGAARGRGASSASSRRPARTATTSWPTRRAELENDLQAAVRDVPARRPTTSSSTRAIRKLDERAAADKLVPQRLRARDASSGSAGSSRPTPADATRSLGSLATTFAALPAERRLAAQAPRPRPRPGKAGRGCTRWSPRPSASTPPASMDRGRRAVRRRCSPSSKRCESGPKTAAAQPLAEPEWESLRAGALRTRRASLAIPADGAPVRARPRRAAAVRRARQRGRAARGEGGRQGRPGRWC